jgi:ribosomal protein S18 acetylase RimI-like enzyme
LRWTFPLFADAFGSNGLANFLEHGDPELLPDLMGVFEQMDQYHPQESHWYLPMVGVDPVCQGRGFGGLLMRHGFEILGTIRVGGAPPVVPMLRQPR